jgi:hypothetical protein
MPTIVEHRDEESVEANTHSVQDDDGVAGAGSEDLGSLWNSGSLELPLAEASSTSAQRVQSILARLQELQVEEQEEFEADNEGDEVMLGKGMTGSLSKSAPLPPESTCEVSVQVEAADLCLPHSMQTIFEDMHKQLQDMHLQFVDHVEARFKQHLGDWKLQVAKEVEMQLSSKLNAAALLDETISHLAPLSLTSEAFESPRVGDAAGAAPDFSLCHDNPVLPMLNLDTEAATLNSLSDGDERWAALPPTSREMEMAAEVREDIESIGDGLCNETITEARSEIRSAMLQEPAWECSSTGSRAVTSECSANKHLLCMEEMLSTLRAGSKGNDCQLLQKQHMDLSCTMILEQQAGLPAASCVVNEHSLETAGGESKLRGFVEARGAEDTAGNTLQKPVCSWFALSPQAKHIDVLAKPSFGEACACETTDAAQDLLSAAASCIGSFAFTVEKFVSKSVQCSWVHDSSHLFSLPTMTLQQPQQRIPSGTAASVQSEATQGLVHV